MRSKDISSAIPRSGGIFNCRQEITGQSQLVNKTGRSGCEALVFDIEIIYGGQDDDLHWLHAFDKMATEFQYIKTPHREIEQDYIGLKPSGRLKQVNSIGHLADNLA